MTLKENDVNCEFYYAWDGRVVQLVYFYCPGNSVTADPRDIWRRVHICMELDPGRLGEEDYKLHCEEEGRQYIDDLNDELCARLYTEGLVSYPDLPMEKVTADTPDGWYCDR